MTFRSGSYWHLTQSLTWWLPCSWYLPDPEVFITMTIVGVLKTNKLPFLCVEKLKTELHIAMETVFYLEHRDFPSNESPV